MEIRVWKKGEMARALGVTPQALSQRIKRGAVDGTVIYVRRGKGRRNSGHSMVFIAEDEFSLAVLKYFYRLSLDRQLSFATFRDLFNELIERGYDLYTFVRDYDPCTVLSLLGYDTIDGDTDDWRYPLAHKLYACLCYAFALSESPDPPCLSVFCPQSPSNRLGRGSEGGEEGTKREKKRKVLPQFHKGESERGAGAPPHPRPLSVDAARSLNPLFFFLPSQTPGSRPGGEGAGPRLPDPSTPLGDGGWEHPAPRGEKPGGGRNGGHV